LITVKKIERGQCLTKQLSVISDNAQTKGQGLAMVSFETLKNAEKATFKKNSFVYSQRFIQIFFL
jgi:hypothetical protein